MKRPRPGRLRFAACFMSRGARSYVGRGHGSTLGYGAGYPFSAGRAYRVGMVGRGHDGRPR